MFQNCRIVFVLATACLLLGSFAHAQPKKPVKKPPVTKPKGGVAQLPGDNGKVGVIYAMGEGVGRIDFTLESAEFQTRTMLAQETLHAEGGQKLLLMSILIQNPQKEELPVTRSSFGFTVVAPNDQNFTEISAFVNADSKLPVDLALKPAQKLRVLVVLRIHAKGPVNKLMVSTGSSQRVLRYDLRGLVKPLKSVFAANGGVDANEEATAALNQKFEHGQLDVTASQVTENEDALEGSAPDENQKTVFVTVAVTNMTNDAVYFDNGTFGAVLKDPDGNSAEVMGLVQASSIQPAAPKLAKGASYTARYAFIVDKSFSPVSLTLSDSLTGRTVVVKLR